VAVKTTMRKWGGGKGWIIPILLTISLALNITGLILPFLEINESFKEPITYSLPHSVHLMWKAKLYIIAALILGFSIIFPFAKLISLYIAWFVPWKSTTRVKFLHVIELMGKWSYMDIFVVILLIALTSHQQWISSNIHIGVYFFVGAITLSMLTSEAIITLAKKQLRAEKDLPILTTRVWLIRDSIRISWVIPILAIISGVALVESLHADFLQIHQVFFVSRSYSIYILGQLLQSMQLWVLLTILVSTLGVFPLLRLVLLLGVWMIPMRIGMHRKMRTVIDSISRWCMLDVFGLALLLIATEGKELVKTEVLSGLYVVVVAICLSYILGAIAIAVSNALTNPSGEES